MNIRLSDNKIILLLLIALVVQILALLWHMEILVIGDARKRESTGQLAGKIQQVENNLKRRPLDSLIWEESKAPENIYYHDSILTLSQSSAKIELQNGTQISLNENTLITIEPPDKKTPEEIRIQFARGNLKTRNPYQSTKIKDGSISLSLKKGSEVEVLKGEEGKYEVLVNKGEALLQEGDSKLAIKQDEVANLVKGEFKKQEVTNTLTWPDSLPLRIYSHGKKHKIDLQWQGLADRVLIEGGGDEKELSFRAPRKETSMELQQGEYRATLFFAEKRSRSRIIQVWQAPSIQLLRPLPRNRNTYGEVTFLWTQVKDIESFELELKGDVTNKRLPANANKLETRFSNDEDLEWGVWGIDQQGYKIPPKYYYPLYIRENPFSAPKLNKPKLLPGKKQSPKTSWLHLFIKPAWAQEKDQALFSWEALPGADKYYLEISQSEDFRQPLVSVELKKAKYLWQRPDAKQDYFWRVAAGDNSGRMGLFSAPTKVEWVKVKPKIKKTAKVKPKAKAKKTVKAVESKKPVREKQKAKLDIFHSAFVAIHSGYSTANYSEGGATKANLTGVTPYSFSAFLNFNWSEQSLITLFIDYGTNRFEPTPEEDFPFQEDLNTQTMQSYILWRPKSDGLGYGLYLASFSNVNRKSFEEVETSPVMLFGPTASYTKSFAKFEYFATLAIATGDSLVGASSLHRLNYPFFFDELKIGIELDAHYSEGGGNKIFASEASLLLGWEF